MKSGPDNPPLPLVDRHPAILMEGAVIERLRRETDLELDPDLLNTPLIYQPAGRAAMAQIYNGYLDIAVRYGLPIMLAAPTWRANPERLSRGGLGDVTTVNRDAVAFLRGICRPYAADLPLAVGGLMACRGDAYDPSGAMPADAAAEFHRPQARSLAAAGADYLMAATLPALSEAIGIARAMAEQERPYLVSFIVRRDGTILDGTPLAGAIETIDDRVSPHPSAYLVNCVHPDNLTAGLGDPLAADGALRRRLLGIQANTSTQPPEALDGADELLGASPEPFADALFDLHRRCGLKILGGCCGTDQRHIEALARRLALP